MKTRSASLESVPDRFLRTFLISGYVLTPHKYRLTKASLMRGYNTPFY